MEDPIRIDDLGVAYFRKPPLGWDYKENHLVLALEKEKKKNVMRTCRREIPLMAYMQNLALSGGE